MKKEKGINQSLTNHKTVKLFILAFTFYFSLLTFNSFSQGVSINANGVQASPGAILDLKSTTEGALLMPRMTSAQITAISSPADGLMIFNTDCQTVAYFNGASWVGVGNSGVLSTPGSITGTSTPSPCTGATNVPYSIATVTGATGYQWTVPPTATITRGQNTTGITVTFGSVSGNICVTANNPCGTSNIKCLPIGPPSSITATASSISLCTGNSLTLTAGGANVTSWSWSGPNGYTSASQSPVLPITSSLQGGVYTVTATNVCGWTSSSTSPVNVFNSPTLSSSSGSYGICGIGNYFQLSGSTTITSTGVGWLSSNGAVANVDANWGYVTGVSIGQSTITYLDINGCSATQNVTVNVYSSASVSIAGNPSSLCPGTITITPTPTVGGTSPSYEWYVNYNDMGSEATYTYTSSANDQIFCYLYSSSDACANNTPMSNILTINQNPTGVSATASPNPVCIGGSTLTLTESDAGATSWQWSGPNSYTSTTQSPSLTINSALQTGIYTVTATNFCGWLSASTASVTVASLPVVSITGPNTRICVGSTTALNPTSGGTWTSNTPSKATILPATGYTVSAIAAGTSTFSFTDGNNCTATTSAVTVVAALTVFTSGTSWTVPASGVTSINVWAIGGGGGGAGSNGANSAGGGGGAGGAAFETFTVTANQTINFTIGAGGNGGSGAAAGSNGTKTTVTVGSTTITGSLGFGGVYNANATQSNGGIGSGTGATVSTGGKGGGVKNASNYGGGGGGGLFVGDAANNAAATGEAGSVWGAGDPLALKYLLTTILGLNTTSNGAQAATGHIGYASTGYGCGGGGGGSTVNSSVGGVGYYGGGGGGSGGNASSNVSGGNGGAGFVVIEY